MATSITRRHLLGLTAGAAAIGLVGCGGDDNSNSSSPTKSAGSSSKATVQPASQVKYWSVHPGGSKDVETELINRPGERPLGAGEAARPGASKGRTGIIGGRTTDD